MSAQTNITIGNFISGLLLLAVGALGSYVYESGNHIVGLQKDIANLSKTMDKVTILLESYAQDRYNLRLLEQKMKNLKDRIRPFIKYGNRFSKSDWIQEKAGMVQYIDNRITQNKEDCREMMLKKKE